MAVNLSFIGGAGWQFFDNNGNVLSGGLLYTYAAGTTTPQTTYTSRSGTIANTNPIILDSAGRTPEQIWSTEGLLYKYVVADSNNVVIRTWDNIGGSVVPSDLAQDLANSSNPAKGDALIGFRQSNSSGNLANSVGRTVHQKLQEIISPLDFGAVGDGITDDSAAFQATLNVANGQIIDGGGRTYKLNSRLNIVNSNTNIVNAVFDFSSAGLNEQLINAAGSLGTAKLLYSTAVAGSLTLSFDASDIADNEWIYLTSTALFSPLQSPTMGEWVRVASVDSSTQVTLAAPILYTYSTTDSAKVQKANFISNITLDTITVIGSGVIGNQMGFSFTVCELTRIQNCTFSKCDNRGGQFITCLGYWVTGCKFTDHTQPGLAYGIVPASGSSFGSIDNNEFWNVKHAVAGGGTNGVTRYASITNNKIYGSTGGIDNHAACEFYVISNNTIYCSGTVASQDAINLNGRTCIVTGNTVINPGRHGILWGPNCPAGFTAQGIIANNSVESTKNTSVGILILNEEVGPIDRLVVQGNSIDGFGTGIYLRTTNGDIKNWNVNGNIVGATNPPATDGVRIESSTDDMVFCGTVVGNTVRCSATALRALYLVASTPNNMFDIVINGNTLTSDAGSAAGLTISGATRITIGSNAINVGGAAYAGTAAIIQTVTIATASVNLGAQSVICNELGTVTLTLPVASEYTGRQINIKTVQAYSVVSASANVIPINESSDGTASTAILPATDGAWAQLVSNGTNWVIMQRGT